MRKDNPVPAPVEIPNDLTVRTVRLALAGRLAAIEMSIPDNLCDVFTRSNPDGMLTRIENTTYCSGRNTLN